MIDLRGLRLAQDLAIIDVAEIMGKSEYTIMNWEKGDVPPRMQLSQFYQLAELLKCSIDELNSAIKESSKGKRKANKVWAERASCKPRSKKDK
jgi:transcriptional regulator with XRE-family HTH domain